MDDSRKRNYPFWNACWWRISKGFAAMDQSCIPWQNVIIFVYRRPFEHEKLFNVTNTLTRTIMLQDGAKVSGDRKRWHFESGARRCRSSCYSRRVHGSPFSNLHSNSNYVSRLHFETKNSSASKHPGLVDLVRVHNRRGRRVRVLELVTGSGSPRASIRTRRWGECVEQIIFKAIEVCSNCRKAP